MEIENWITSVKNHQEYVNTIVEVRKTLKSQMDEHLKSVFNYDSIEYSTDLSKITLKWSPTASPIIKHDKIGQLGMDWVIHAGYDDHANRIVIIEVYPFGIS